jgi:hypothetical protein
MTITIKDDYTIEDQNINDNQKYIRELQLDATEKTLYILDSLMTYLGKGYKIFQYNTHDFKEQYDYFMWRSEDQRTITLTTPIKMTIRKRIIYMENLLTIIKGFSTYDIKVWVKMNNIKSLIEEEQE